MLPHSSGRVPLSSETSEPRRPSVGGGDASIAAPRPRWSSPPHAGHATRVESGGAPDQARRALHVGVALVVLVLTAPLMAMVALAVRATSPGPILSRRPRVGLDRRRERESESVRGRRSADWGGRIFNAYTFRVTRESTVHDQDQPSDAEAEVTPLGSLLKASRLDGLPQLFNVLLGDMNVVGPRPERPELLRELRDELGASFPRYAERQRVLPGIIGPAQVARTWSGYDGPQDGLRCDLERDLEYVLKRSAFHDLSIMASIILGLFLPRIRG